MKTFINTAALLCMAAAAHGQTSAPLLDVRWVDGAAAVAPDRFAAATDAPTIWWRVLTAGMVFSDGGLSLSPRGAYACSRQPDPRLYRCDKVGEARGDYGYSIKLEQMAAVPKSPPVLPDGWIQSE